VAKKMISKEKVHLLNSSAILTILEAEEGVEEVKSILKQAEEKKAKVYLPFMVLMEVIYKVWQKEGKEEAKEVATILKGLKAEDVTLNEYLIWLAAEIKANYRLSVADAWIVASAIFREAKLVHK
jgi:ribonuclease VapC